MSPGKRRAKGDGSLYQRTSDGLWVARVELPNGRRRTRYAPTKKTALAKLKAMNFELDEHGALVDGRRTVDTWLQEWLRDIAPARVKPKTLDDYKGVIRLHITPAVGHLRLERLTAKHVRDLTGELERAGLTSTTRKAYTVLSEALTHAQREGLVRDNAAKNIDRPKVRPHERQPLTADEAAQLLQSMSRTPWDPRLVSRWIVALMLGLRQGEALGLRWDAIDLDRALLDVSWQLQRIPWAHGCGNDEPCRKAQARSCPTRRLDMRPDLEHHPLVGNHVLVRPKSKAGLRTIPVPPAVMATLRARYVDYLHERGGYVRDHRLVWCGTLGQPIDAKADWQAFQDHLQAAGLERREPHTLRHTTATLLRRLGVDDDVRMAILGHATMQVHRGYAGHTEQAEMAEALGRLVGQVYELEG